MVSAIIGNLESQLERIQREVARLNALSFNGEGYRREQGEKIAREFGAVGLDYDMSSGGGKLSRVSVHFEGFSEPTQQMIADAARQIEEKLGGSLEREVNGNPPYANRLRAQVPTEILRLRLLGIIPIGKPVQDYGSVSALYGNEDNIWKALVSVYSPEIDNSDVRRAADILAVLFGYKSPRQKATEKYLTDLVKSSSKRGQRQI